MKYNGFTIYDSGRKYISFHFEVDSEDEITFLNTLLSALTLPI